jgi:hypothetical protein
MIKFKEKLYFWPAALMVGTTGVSMAQSSAQASDAERQAEESQRLQKKMNKELARIADSGDPAKGQQAAAVLQGQAFSDVANDVGEDLSNGVKKAGNAIGGAAGTVTGGAVGSVLGAGASMAGAGLYNKYAVGDAAKNATKGATTTATKALIPATTTATTTAAKGATTAAKGATAGINKIGIGKAGKYGAIAGLIGGSILGGQSGSSLFSQKSFAAGSELIKAGKGLWKVAGQHKGTIAEGLAAGAVMGGAGYAANKMIQSDEKNGTNNSLGKIATLGAGAVLGGMALKKGANWGAFGKNGARYAKRAGSALQIGGGFGAGMAAIPAITKSQQQQAMAEDTGGGQKKKSGMGTTTKVLLGAGLALGAAKGGHMLAKSGKLGFTGGQRDAAKKVAENISDKISTFKDTALRKAGMDKLAEGRLKYNEAQKMAKTNPKYENPEFMKSPGEYLLDKTTAFLGSGTQKTQRLADQLKATDSKILQDTGKFMNKYKKTALVGAAVPGYMATMGTWQKGEDLTNKALKKIDPKAFEENNDNI